MCPWFQAHARVLLESALTPKFPLRFSKPPLTTPVSVNTRESFEDKELCDSYGFVSQVRPHALTMFEGSKWAWGRTASLSDNWEQECSLLVEGGTKVVGVVKTEKRLV